MSPGRIAPLEKAFIHSIMDKTLIILKPDAFEKRRVGAIIERFEQAGLEIVATRMMRLSSEQLREHYAHIADKPFYPEVEEFMGCRPVLVMVIQGENVVERVRKHVGLTDSRRAVPGTIRGDWGTNMMMNLIHASDSDESAALEIERFFDQGEVYTV